MTKFSLFLSFFLILAGSIKAQSPSKNWVRAQAGYGFCGNGDRSGILGNLSGGRYFSPRFKAGLGIGYTGFDNGVYEPATDNFAKVWSLEANAFFNVLHSKYFKIEIGAGPHLQWWDWQYRAEPNTTIVLSGPDIRVLPGETVSFQETQFGYNLSLGLVITPIPNFELGFWGVHQSGLQGNNISTLRAGLGFRF